MLKSTSPLQVFGEMMTTKLLKYSPQEQLSTPVQIHFKQGVKESFKSLKQQISLFVC